MRKYQPGCPCPACGSTSCGPADSDTCGDCALPRSLTYTETSQGAGTPFNIFADWLPLDGPVPMHYVPERWETSVGFVPFQGPYHWISDPFEAEDTDGRRYFCLIFLGQTDGGGAIASQVRVWDQAGTANEWESWQALDSAYYNELDRAIPGAFYLPGSEPRDIWVFPPGQSSGSNQARCDDLGDHGLIVECAPARVLATWSPNAILNTTDFGTGTFSESGTPAWDDCPPGCWIRVSLSVECGSDCPSEGAAFTVRDTTSDRIYGPTAPLVQANPDTDSPIPCVQTLFKMRVFLPEGPEGTIPARTFKFLDYPSGDEIHELTTPAFPSAGECEDVGDVLGADATVVALCVTGCPEGPLSDAHATISVYDPEDDSLISGQTTSPTGEDGCISAIFDPNDFPASKPYRVEVSLFPNTNGYANSSLEFVRTFRAASPGTTVCDLVDLGTVEAALADTHACSPCGPAWKCWNISGPGPDFEATYDADAAGAGLGGWEAVELLPGAGRPTPGSAFCAFTTPVEDATIPVLITFVDPTEEEEGEGVDCVLEARRVVPSCVEEMQEPPYPNGCPLPPPLLASDDPADFRETICRLPVARWGPAGSQPGTFTFGGAFPWTNEDGEVDPFGCDAPIEGYAQLIAEPCLGGEPLMMAAAPAPTPGRPAVRLPSAGRMARELVRTTFRAIRHAAATGRVRASAEEQERRWTICRSCDHITGKPERPRCGKRTGCGCWLKRAIPLEAKDCPLGRWAQSAAGPSADTSSEPAGGLSA